MKYGEFIKKHRVASGYKSQRELARATNISAATISRIEDEKHVPEVETLRSLAKRLHTTTLFDLMTVCGHLDENDSANWQDDGIIKETPVPYGNEKEFLDNIELSEEELLKQFKLTLDGRELTEEEARKLITFLRVDRQMNS